MTIIRISALLALFAIAALAEPKEAAAPKATSSKAAKPKPIPRTGPKKLFPVRVETGGRTLHINGWGLCEWGILNWDLYYAALHCERTSKSGSKLTGLDQGYQVHLHFLRDLTQDQMRKAYRASMKANAGKELSQYQKRLDRLLSMMRAVKKGDDLRFLYLPGEGMTVSFNGKAAGTIPGADWGKKFLELYVGSKPPTWDLRKGLLSR